MTVKTINRLSLSEPLKGAEYRNTGVFPHSLHRPENEDDYDTLVLVLDELLKITGDDESHPLMSLVDIIGDWIEEWDHTHHPMAQASGEEVLGYMMREHGLTQSDLPGVGPQSVVSEILSGKRKLNLRQIRWLAERFNVPIDVFT
ncbi:helix-turn-helix domain-containing protein [Pseudomonas granadensis]|uniref:helix-turn-helix domain-containing protein n=1 Tax=Pseudomonas granadensis TaxID=1421430 RepID=UPI001EF15FF2|nr:transcriptional regulator [Pseudomonas granadensis]